MIVTSSAKLRYVSIPPRKMRLVANMVKGLPVQKALDILNFTPKIAARHVAKTLKSAAANALSVEGTDVVRAEDLLIKNIVVDAAPTAKRIRFQSMGRVYRYRKRYCHLTVTLQGETEEAQAPGRTRKKAEETKSAKPKAKKKATEKKPAKSKKPAKKKAESKAAKDDKAEAKPKKSTAKKATAAKKETNAKKETTAKKETKTKDEKKDDGE